MSELQGLRPITDAAWEVPVGFGQELHNILGSVAESYVFRSMDDPAFIEQKLHSAGLQVDSSIFCYIREVDKVRNETDREKKLGFKVTLMKDEERLCDVALVHTDAKIWEFSHRHVSENFRNKGIFGHVQAGLENFIQRRADITQEKQIIFLTAGQPDVIRAFEKKGYLPQSQEDAERIRRILHPDDGLLLDYTYRCINHADGTQIYEPDHDRNLYCFERSKVGNGKDKSLLLSTNAFRAGLQKEFFPRTKEVEEAAAKTAHRIDETVQKKD